MTSGNIYVCRGLDMLKFPFMIIAKGPLFDTKQVDNVMNEVG